MYLSSELVLTEKNIAALEEYVQKSKVFHHLWKPVEETEDIKKAILMY